MITLMSLGAFALRLGQRVITHLPTDKVQALCVYLALAAPHLHRRESLAALLWPEIRHQSALNNLRQTLHRLRTALDDLQPGAGSRLLTIDRQTVQFHPAALTIDALTFTRLLDDCADHAHGNLAGCDACLARLTQAVALYQGELLAGFGLPDAPAFEEWLLYQREHLQQRALTALAQVVAAYESRGADDFAQPYLERLLALDPYQDAGHQQLMRLLVRRGLSQHALTHYENYRRNLDTELGVAPAAETTALYAQIKAGGGAPARHTALRQETALWPHNLPPPVTSLVGRSEELARVLDYLATPTRRLITLLGEGGIGKSRLALEAAHTVVNQRLGAFADGIHFVSLVGVTTVDSAVSALANSLGLTLTGAADPQQQLLAQLRTRRLLLLLDNLEQLADVVPPLIMAILEAAPGITLLTTSRVRLNLTAEWVLTLRGLPFPTLPPTDDPSRPGAQASADAQPLSGALESYSAIQLFVTRAQQTDDQFNAVGDPDQMAAIAQICVLLQGMPLGIELAASWVSILSCRTIANEIAQSLDILTTPYSNLPERHRSIQAAFAHSWQLLTPIDQGVLAALSVFQGGFTPAAASQVAAASLLTLRRLVDHSLLNQAGDRFALHELLRQFAEEQLMQDADRRQRVLARHSHYYLHFLAARERGLAGPEVQQALAELQAEANNIRHAWTWAAANQRWPELDHALYALWRFYLLNNASGEAEQLLTLAITAIRQADPSPTAGSALQPLLSKLLTISSQFLWRLGNFAQARLTAEEAVAIADGYLAADQADLARLVVKVFADWAWAFILTYLLEVQQMQRVIQAALHLIAAWPTADLDPAEPHREMMHDLQWRVPLYMGLVLNEMGDAAQARLYVTQALHLCRRYQFIHGQLHCLASLGWFEFLAANYGAARQAIEEISSLAQRYPFPLEKAAYVVELGRTVRLQGDYGLAQELLMRGWQLAGEINSYVYQYNTAEGLTLLYCYLGAYPEAQQWFAQMQPTGADMEVKHRAAQSVLARLQGHYQQAVEAALQARQSRGQRSMQARVLVLLGHAQAALHQWPAAAESYTQALALFTTLQMPTVAVEAQAGLATVALAQDNLAAALIQVEAILPVLAAAPYVGVDEPFDTYWACYRVLTAAQDQRVITLLTDANQRLAAYADHIRDDGLRQSFWERVPLHRDLRAAYLQQNKGIV